MWAPLILSISWHLSFYQYQVDQELGGWKKDHQERKTNANPRGYARSACVGCRSLGLRPKSMMGYGKSPC